MNNKKKILIPLFGLLLFSACQSDDDVENANINESRPCMVAIDAKVATGAANKAKSTRLNTDVTGHVWDVNDVITVIKVDEYIVKDRDSASYQFDGTKWNQYGSEYMLWAQLLSQINEFKAWYPGLRKGTTDTTFVMPSDQSKLDSLKQADWMTAHQTQTEFEYPDSTLALTFYHKLAKITVKIDSIQDQYKQSSDSHDEYLHSPVFTLTTNPNVGSDSVAIKDNASLIKGYVYDDTDLDGKVVLGVGDSITAIVLPGTYNDSDTLVRFYIDNDLLVTYVPNVFTTTGLRAGDDYKIKIIVGKETIKIKSVTIKEWDGTDIEYNNHRAEEE